GGIPDEMTGTRLRFAGVSVRRPIPEQLGGVTPVDFFRMIGAPAWLGPIHIVIGSLPGGINMATSSTSNVLHPLYRVALFAGGAGLSDGELLEAFFARREGAFFEVLVRRHGPMVLGVCQRILRNLHDG